jgi:hypothetical protein
MIKKNSTHIYIYILVRSFILIIVRVFNRNLHDVCYSNNVKARIQFD